MAAAPVPSASAALEHEQHDEHGEACDNDSPAAPAAVQSVTSMMGPLPDYGTVYDRFPGVARGLPMMVMINKVFPASGANEQTYI